MVPSAYVRLAELPRTANGKVNREALPAPGVDAFGNRAYSAPEGEVEHVLAQIWRDVLKVPRVGRDDNFFELGGHSLLAVTLVERMRKEGLYADVRSLFKSRTLAELSASVSRESGEVTVPPNLVPADAARLTPGMLPLVQLSQAQLDAIVSQVPGGAANVQDIYSLAPLQEGILFHHLKEAQGDAYLLPVLLRFDTRAAVDAFARTMQEATDRHDILRTSVMWEGLDEAVQVVQRRVRFPLEVVTCHAGDGDVGEQLKALYDPKRHRLDVRKPPLIRAYAARDEGGDRWLVMLLLHHLVADHTTLELLGEEARLIAEGQGSALPAPELRGAGAAGSAGRRARAILRGSSRRRGRANGSVRSAGGRG
jgi:aryl carrier-like protein